MLASIHLLIEGRPLERLASGVQCWAHDAMLLATHVERMTALSGYNSVIIMQAIMITMRQMPKWPSTRAPGASVCAMSNAHAAGNRGHCCIEVN